MRRNAALRIVIGFALVCASAAGCEIFRPPTMQSFWKLEPGQQAEFKADMKECQRNHYSRIDTRAGGSGDDAVGWKIRIQHCMETKGWVPK